jgi:uncharacterized UBP type Zn finger protein
MIESSSSSSSSLNNSSDKNLKVNSVLEQIRILFTLMHLTKKSYVSVPSDFIYQVISRYKFRLSQQHDAEEFMGRLIDDLNEQLSVYPTNLNENSTSSQIDLKTIIKECFVFNKQSIISCNNCQYESNSNDSGYGLSLTFPEQENHKIFTLESLIDNHFKINDIEDFNCSSCHNKGGKQRFIFNESLKVIPQYLIISFVRHGNSLSKIMTEVLYELFLNTSFIKSSKSVYELTSIVIHAGSQLSRGHYYTYTTTQDKKWFKLNDTSVSQIKFEEIVRNLNILKEHTPYILFYKLLDNDVNIKSNSLVNNQKIEENNLNSFHPSLVKFVNSKLLNGAKL